MKKIVYIFLIVLLSGCSATIDIELDRKGVKEIVTITTSKEYLDSVDEEELAKEFADFEYGFENYEKELIYNSNDSISKKYSYTNDYDNYELMTFLNKCYSEVNVERRQELVISTSSEFLCYDYFKDLDEVKIRMKSIYKSKENNSDKKEGKYYVWEINKDNYLNKPIKIIFTNEYDRESNSSYMMFILLAAIIVVMTIVIRKIKKANEY